MLTPQGKYNLLAQLLSDNSHLPIRFSLFKGKTKASTMYAVREFGNMSLLMTLDRVLDYGEILSRGTLAPEQTIDGFLPENLFQLIRNCRKYFYSFTLVKNQVVVYQRY